MLPEDQWLKLIEYLGVPRAQIDQLKNDYPQMPRKQATNGLELWKGSYNAQPEVKVRDILGALDKVGRPDIKQNIARDYEGVKGNYSCTIKHFSCVSHLSCLYLRWLLPRQYCIYKFLDFSIRNRKIL